MVYTKSTDTLYINVWSWYTVQEIVYFLSILKPKRFIYDCRFEYETSSGFFEHSNLNLINDYVKISNIEAFIFLGSLNKENYIENKQPDKFYPDFTIIYVPLMFCYRTFQSLTYTQPKTTPGYLFYALINRPHNHRCILVDKLNKYNLTNDVGKFTWNILKKDYHNGNFKFKYWKEELIIADTYKNTENPFSKPEQQYFESVFDLVLESTIETCFYTEKTYKPLILGKPFIIYGKQNINSNLKGLGFKLYTEVVNYDFDNIEDDTQRAEALAIELVRLSKYSYQEILNKMQETVKYNKELAIKYGKDIGSTEQHLIDKHVISTYQ